MSEGLYVIKDDVAEQFGPVFQAVNNGTALRNFFGLLSKVAKYDRDSYRLFRIGSYDQETGVVQGEDHVLVESEIPKFDEIRSRDFGFEESR